DGGPLEGLVEHVPKVARARHPPKGIGAGGPVRCRVGDAPAGHRVRGPGDRRGCTRRHRPHGRSDDGGVAQSRAGRTGKTTRAGRPPVTSRAEILAAARRLIESEGWERVTIRRLAGELGIGATTLYHHVRDKWELQVLMLNEYAAQIPRPDPPERDPARRIVAAATAVHDSFAAWPWGADASAVDGFITLLDESALWPVEEIVAAARDAGCDEAQAVALFRNV